MVDYWGYVTTELEIESKRSKFFERSGQGGQRGTQGKEEVKMQFISSQMRIVVTHSQVRYLSPSVRRQNLVRTEESD